MCHGIQKAKFLQDLNIGEQCDKGKNHAEPDSGKKNE